MVHFNFKRIFLGVLFVLLFIFLQYNNVSRFFPDRLASYDPYYHMAMTDYTIKEEKVIFYIPDSAYPNTKPMYLTLLYPLSADICLLTWISSIHLFQIMGSIILFFMALFIFIITRRKYWSSVGYFSITLFLSINYLLTRSSMNLPENYALFFILILLYLLFFHKKAYLVAFFCSIYLFFHYRSAAILVLILLIILSVDIFNNFSLSYIKKNIGTILKWTFFVIILSFPVFIELLSSYLYFPYTKCNRSR